MPAWYRLQVKGQTFVPLPLTLAGQPLGLIYGDHAVGGRIKLAEHEMAQVRALRDQGLDAFHNAVAR